MTTTPQKLGRYEVVEEIGKGAMGVVYLARDPLIGRLVALKTFRIGFAARDEELAQFRSRFVREAQSAGILSHPNIVTIHDVVDEGPLGGCFIAMEYVKGTNLKQLLQRPDPLPLSFAVDVVAQISEALDYAHSRGVVHRDVKPANILITPENRVKITDFGIARIDSSNLTMEGQLLGTPNYMAPEQIQGKEVDHRADIFSLGVVFYEMLTRKKPFQGENMTAVTHKIVYDAFTPPEEIVRDLPKGFTAVLTRCLEKDPNRRFPRASEVGRELRGVVQQQQVLEDTVATQEVEPILAGPEAVAPAAAQPASSAVDPTSLPTAVIAAAAEMVPTRIVARPQLPLSPGGDQPLGDNAPTQLVARPPIQEFRATLASPPKPAPPMAAAPATGAPTGAQAAAPGVAATVISAVPRASKSAPASQDASAAPAAAQPTLEPPPAVPLSSSSSRRGLLTAAAALIILGMGAGAALWIARTPRAPNAAVEAAPAPAPEQQTRVTAAAALSEARSQLAQGDLDGALQAVARAELAEPDSTETVKLREEIEARRQELAESARQAKLDDGLRAARYAYGERRYSDAMASAKAVLALDAGSEEGRKIYNDADRALKRIRERQQAIEAAQQQPAPVPVAEPVAPVAPAIDPASMNETELTIDFASQRPEGTLTVYVGDRQILREAFRFVRRTGFLAREKTSGTISAVRKVRVGSVALKVYVALPGKATRAILIDAEFAGGTRRTLVIRVDGEGNASAGVG